MIEGDFVQFYEPRRSSAGIGFRPDGENKSYCYTCNGFSYLSDQIREHWVDTRLWKKFEPLHEKVYVSVWYGFQQHIVMEWVRKFPKNQFVLGGPLYKTNQIRYTDKEIPDNVYFTSELAEDYFKIPINLKSWKLNFPYRDYPLQYSYNIGSRCYWGKCSFCWPTCHTADQDRRKGYNLEPLKRAPEGEVVLSIPAPTPQMLIDIIPIFSQDESLNKGKVFSIYLRAGSKELEALKSIRKKIDFRRITFCIGVEFPSDRMLKVMNKGVTLQEYLNMYEFLDKNDAQCVSYFITSWPDITEDDIKEVEYFFKKAPKAKDRFRFIWGRLISYETIVPKKKINSNVTMTMMKAYNTELNEKDFVLNEKYRRLLNEYGGIERIIKNPERKLPIIDKENLYKKYVLPLDK